MSEDYEADQPSSTPAPPDLTPPDPTQSDDDKRAKRMKAGIGIGIGSAAIVAALLYTNRSSKKKSDKPRD